MGLRMLRNGGGCAKQPVRESDIMKEHRRNPECSYRNSVIPGAKSPNRNGIREFRLEFCQNLQPRSLDWIGLFGCVCESISPADRQRQLHVSGSYLIIF
jgi:hypothetical protein